MPYSQVPYDFNSYAAGNKRYGFSARSAPTMGAVDKLGYRERDRTATTRRNALLRRLKASNSKKFMSADWLGGNRA